MGYLTADLDLNMNEVTVSSFFRIPPESAAAARANFKSYFGFRVLLGVVPICMWGPQQTGSDNSGSYPIGPSWIGVRYTDDNTDGTLDVNIQTDQRASVSSADNFNYTDDIPQYFGNSDADSSSSGAGHPGPIPPGVWHHMMTSWRLSQTETANGSGVQNPSLMNCVINRANMNGANLPALGGSGFGLGANEMASWVGSRVEGDAGGLSILSVGQIPSSPFTIPGHPVSSGNGAVQNLMIELAYFQVITGMAVDPADVSIFLDDNGEPTDPAITQEVLGKRPEILFAAATDWLSGTNVGTAGPFSVVGTLLKTRPNPKLGA